MAVTTGVKGKLIAVIGDEVRVKTLICLLVIKILNLTFIIRTQRTPLSAF